MDCATGLALVLGAARPFGAEIVARLGADGYRIGASPALCPPADGGCIDVLVINAPTPWEHTPFCAIDDAQFAAALENFYALADAHCALAARLAGGARVVHVASRGFLGGWGGAHLMAASAAIVAYGRALSLELAGRGICVNTVAPDLAGGPWDQGGARRQVAEAVAYFARPALGVSGESLLIDGGKSLRATESRRPQT